MAAVSHSAEIINCNDDLLHEVLLRLPIWSLLRFKSELKFTDVNRISNSNTSTKGPFQNSLIFAGGDFSGLRIIQSCNGLLLLRSGAYNLEYGSSVTCIYNPSSNKYTKLPNTPVRSDKVSVVVGQTLAFDPLKSPHYKVVCIRYFSSNNVKCYRKMEIYSSETGSWTLSSASLKMGMLNAQFDSGVFWNGSVHWISPWGDYLYFNVDEERSTKSNGIAFGSGWLR
ncbi:Galactose oxidase, beta-propeller [Parasponia andersonii]|uniref:Galactose oxidase, beta-propeller n=1 Tax=Parasponia andersonii TaxID=3476 RepID=A0A2P5BQP9_PARAD|nr:Galactose oxidase, beta-propeller [Parasponia andersonii]